MPYIEETRAVFKSACRTYRLASLAGLPMWGVGQARDDAAAAYRQQLQLADMESAQLLEFYEEIADDYAGNV